MEPIEKSVLNLICDHFDLALEKINLDAHFIKDLGVESIDAIEFIIMCEHKFHLIIPDKEVELLLTPRNAINYIERHL